MNTCPSWHYLPGPYQTDPERTECPHRGTHDAQRRNAIIFTPDSAGFQPRDDAPPSSIHTVKRDGRWVRLEP